MENLSFTVIEGQKKVTLDSFRSGKKVVIDFWHTRCTKCPAALEKLDKKARSSTDDNLIWASCGLSLTDGDFDIVQEMCEDTWENLKHLYMTVEEKEVAKSIFDFKAVPFCVCFDASGKLVASGDPKNIDFDSVFTEASTKAAASETSGASETPALSFDEDF